MPKKILLADDSITIQKVVELTFSDGDYEVTAVNNGAKAIQKLSEMRPDIVLSDIIMPEKNGYEVCEYIKSHPEFRSIPVVLLTGTFEPFDPDRAEKAGCDAVVTKPFESQSLIHKIDELINASRSAAVPTPQPPAVAPQAPDLFTASAPLDPVSPWPAPTAPAPAPLFGSGTDSPFAPPAADSPFDSAGSASPSRGASPHDADIFGTPSTQAPPLSFTPSTPAAEPEAFGGETRAFPRMSFDDLQQTSAQPAAATPAPAEADRPSPVSPAAPEASPWETTEPSVPAFGGETKAFPRMSFDDLQPASTTHAPVVQPPAPPAPAEDPWQVPEPEPQPEVPAFGAETHAFPQLNYDDLHSPASAPTGLGHDQETTPPSIWDDQPPAAAPSWSSDAGSSQTQHVAADDFPAAAASPFAEPTADEASPFAAGTSEESSPGAAYHPEPAAPPWSGSSHASDSESAADIYEPAGNELSEAQIDRIARRVVQLMSDQLVRNIAWEVIPDLAEMVVKERVRQLEAEEN